MRLITNYVLAILFAKSLGLTQNNPLQPEIIQLQEVNLQTGQDSDHGRSTIDAEDRDEIKDLKETSEVRKRISVEFMGMHLSFPQYLRLVKLQEKVIRLNKMIESLNQKFTKEQLNSLPQYKELLYLQKALMPLLPEHLRQPNDMIRSKSRSSIIVEYDDDGDGSSGETTDEMNGSGSLQKRSEVSKRMSVDFMGIHVSYPQYLRLVRLQEKVIRLKKMIEDLNHQYSDEQLNSVPQYKQLMHLHMSLMPLLPESLREPYELIRNHNSSTYSVNFDGLRVPYAQYLKIKALQEKINKLDQMMKQIADKYPKEELENIPRWTILSSMRKALKKNIETLSTVQPHTLKRYPSIADSNSTDVSAPQYNS